MSHRMARWDMPCGLPDGHNGRHRRPESLARIAERRASPEARAAAAEGERGRRRSGQAWRALARQLMRGERILSQGMHHAGMRKLKEWMGDPRPTGLQLSLIRPDSPSAYEGYYSYRGEKRSYLLSTNPMDYRWETPAENVRRQVRPAAADYDGGDRDGV